MTKESRFTAYVSAISNYSHRGNYYLDKIMVTSNQVDIHIYNDKLKLLESKRQRLLKRLIREFNIKDPS